jgi:hypothetical protein
MDRFLVAGRTLEKSPFAAPVPAEHPRALPGCSTMASPEEIVRDALLGDSVVGWKLDREQRARLLERFAPKYGTVVADHVTLARVNSDTPLPDAVLAEAVGHIDDDRGVEALVVAIDGSTERPDGSTYHITWSLGPRREAKESNDVLASAPWQPLREPVPLSLTPARWP